MDASTRSPREIEAERAVRRGEFKVALGIYRQLLAERPDDPAIASRIRSIESLAQPSELESALRIDRPITSPAPERPLTMEQQAELLFERGDFQGALATYQRLLQSRPNHELARERLREIQTLASLQPGPAPDPALPSEPTAMLEALLVRIASRRRA